MTKKFENFKTSMSKRESQHKYRHNANKQKFGLKTWSLLRKCCRVPIYKKNHGLTVTGHGHGQVDIEFQLGAEVRVRGKPANKTYLYLKKDQK